MTNLPATDSEGKCLTKWSSNNASEMKPHIVIILLQKNKMK